MSPLVAGVGRRTGSESCVGENVGGRLCQHQVAEFLPADTDFGVPDQVCEFGGSYFQQHRFTGARFADLFDSFGCIGHVMFGLRSFIACAGTLAIDDDAANANVRHNEHSGRMCAPAIEGKPKKTSAAGARTSREAQSVYPVPGGASTAHW